MVANLAQLLGAPGAEYFSNGNTYTAASSGLITGGVPLVGPAFSGIAPGDVVNLMNAGCRYTSPRSEWIYLGAPAAASATALIANAAAANGALTVAAQPDVPRPGQYVLAPGTAAITAGSLTITYTSTTGQTITDTVSLITPSGTNITGTTSHGIAHLTAAAIAGIAGGVSPTIQLGTNASLSVPLPPQAVSLSVFKENVDGANEAVGTVTTAVATNGDNVASIATTTAPNGTHTFSLGFSYFQ